MYIKNNRVSPQLQSTFLDYPDNESIAVSVYYYGCEMNCPDCQNRELQNPNSEEGIMINPTILAIKIAKACDRNDTNKVVLLGGDPFYPSNRIETIRLLNLLHDSFDVCVYTGYTREEIQKFYPYPKFKYLKAGRYDKYLAREAYKTDDEFVLASSNQAFYDENYMLLSENGVLKFKEEKLIKSTKNVQK